MTKPADDALEIIEQEARDAAKCFGIADSNAMAARFIERVILRLGGECVYVPQKRPRDRHEMRQEIRRRFNGANASELSREFGISVRWVRKIAAQ